MNRHDWVVYAKTALAGSAAVLDYLSRYTQRTAIGNERLMAIRGQQVLLRVRGDERGGKRIRHYGLLAPAAKAQRLALARSLLQMPMPNPHAVEDAAAFMRRVAAIDIERCTHYHTGRWRCVQSLPAERAALAAITTSCRGPP